MEICYEYFDCKQINCVRREKTELNCWEIEDSSCKAYDKSINILRENFSSKLDACKVCVYYQYAETHIQLKG